MSRRATHGPCARGRPLPRAIAGVLVLAAAVLVQASVATAQANEEPADTASQLPDPPGFFDLERWALRMDFSFSGSAGNNDLVVLSSSFRLRHLNTELFELELSGRNRYGRSEGETVAQNLRGGLKFDLFPEDKWSPFVFTTAERDPLRRLDLRASGGAGAKYTFWRSARGDLSVSLAALYSYEDYRLSLGSALDQFQHTGRWSWRLKGERRLGEDATLEGMVFYQPAVGDGADYLVDSEARLGVRLTDRLSLTLSHAFQRDSQPPEDVQRDDHAVEVGLSVTL